MPEGAVYVGRPTIWGNPFPKNDPNCLESYRQFITDWVSAHQKSGSDALYNLRGKDLACWCKEGEPCHADILLELAHI